MAATRKSDFVGDRFGDFEVVERADAIEGKRRWKVRDGEGNERTVYQTELKGLAKIPAVRPDDEGVWRNDLGQRIHGDADPIRAGMVDGETRTVTATPTYEPGGEHCEAAMIALAVIDWTRDMPVESYSRPDEDVFVACPADPDMECEGRCPATDDDWTVTLPVDTSGAYELVEKAAGLGESAEPEATEAELDRRAAETPQDPMKKAIRDVFDVTVELRQALARAEAAHVLMGQELTDLQMQYEQLMEKLDVALKAAITR